MNKLVLGTNKTELYTDLTEPFLLVVDELPDFDFPSQKKTIYLDLERHNLNPLQDIDYLRATDLLSVLDAVFPEGSETLTKRYANFQILEALLDEPKRLDHLIDDSKETHDAYQKVQRLFLSPVLRQFLKPAATNFKLDRTIIAILDRSKIGDFDAFVIGNLLASRYEGQVVFEDFGFYACAFHMKFLRQNRLIAGINSFDEVPEFKNHLLLVETKIANHCNVDDAETLALYAGYRRDSRGFADFVQTRIE